MKVTPLVEIPKKVKVGDIIEIKTSIRHAMPNKTADSKRQDSSSDPGSDNGTLRWLVVKFNNKEIFRTELSSSISANPYISFHFKVSGPGEFLFLWAEDSGTAWVRKHKLNVS